MAKRSKQDKIAEDLIEVLSNYYFDYVGLANKLVTFAPHYTIDQLVKLMESIIIAGNNRYNSDWHNNITTEGLVILRDWYRILQEETN